MSEDLLLELETPEPVAGSLENLERLVRLVVPDVRRAVEGMRGSTLTFENAWRRIIVEIANGRTKEMQEGVRPRLLSAFEKRLHLLKETHALATWLFERGRDDVPSPNVLEPEIAGMERLKISVFDRWQTAEDLENLAARDYALTTADLDQIGPRRRPPASWYAEESKPF